jgi:polar amino acid transport system permease protein
MDVVDLGVIVDNLPYLMSGLRLTFALSLIAIGLAFVVGCPLGLARGAHSQLIRLPAILYIEIMRGTPLIMVIFWIFFFLPKITQLPMSATVSGTAALILFYASHIAEITRAGVQAVPKSQVEGAQATGLNYVQLMSYVVLPQALRNMIPALISRFVAIVMATSLLSILGVVEFFRAANIVNNREIRSYEIYTFVAVIYFVACYLISWFGRWCERRLSAKPLVTNQPVA